MATSTTNNEAFSVPSVLRRILLSWLIGTTIEYIILPHALKSLAQLEGIAQMSLLRIAVLTIAVFLVLIIINRPTVERWAIATTYGVFATVVLVNNFTVSFLLINLLVVTGVLVYAVKGWNHTAIVTSQSKNVGQKYRWMVAAFALAFFIFVSIWTVCRVWSFSTPTFDFGIFSQMFHNMKQTGLPITTVERDGMLSHFKVHVSLIYYLLLPFYWIFPSPATLQILQAAVLASAVIPLWKIGKQHGLSELVITLLCTLFLFYPAFSGSTSYDIHENAFLSPLILWLFWSVDRKNTALTCVFAFLVLFVKEDAAVYVAVIGLFYLLTGLLYKNRWQISKGLFLIGIAIVWFILVTNYLTKHGDGVMTYRYNNFMYDQSGSLFTVIKSVFLCPMKALFECVDAEKLQYIALTMLPLGFIPLITRRYERLILLIPYVLINLMSDYRYQHDIFFQYNFGSIACLVYMTAINIADVKAECSRIFALASALTLCITLFTSTVVPKAMVYPKRCLLYADHYSTVRQVLDLIPDDASVSATTFYTTYLSQRSILYDIQYASQDHVLSTEYIVLSKNSSSYKKYDVEGNDGFENLITLLESNGYTLFAELEGTLTIYHKE